MKNKWCLIICIHLYMLSYVSKGQLIEYGIPNKTDKKRAHTNYRIQQDPLPLPFWDDFYSTSGVPNDSLWASSEDVLINQHYAYLPPSSGVATFDGLTADGFPYNTDPESSEKIDRLTSHAINLSSYTVSDNIVLSFFYQYGGYGELPDLDDGDKLQVEFKNADGVWTPVREVFPEEDINPQVFYFLALKIEDESYFHDDFQFAIQIFGNQAGPYDIWNVDYVYLNNHRTVDDFYFPDRAINQSLTSIFREYTAIPRTHINLEEDLQAPYYLLNNLYDNFQTYRQSATITVETTEETSVVNYPLTAEGTSSPIFRDEIDTIRVPFPIMEELPEVDSLVRRISYEVAVNTFDNRIDSGNYDLKYAPIDFRVSDTIRRDYILEDYYAYDDGTAEGAAGLQVAGNVLAYKFHLMNVDSAFIHGIDINTVYAGESANGKSIDLHVWSNGGGKPGQRLTNDRVVINADDLRSTLTRYNLRKPVVVKDTFYIGFTLNSSGRFPIGLDKNSNNANKVLENVQGAWSPVGDRIVGTLMIRPFVGPEPDEPVTSIEIPVQADLSIYPNPSADGLFYFNKKVQNVEVITVSGQDVSFSLSDNNKTSLLHIDSKGLFIVKILFQDQIYFKKVLIK